MTAGPPDGRQRPSAMTQIDFMARFGGIYEASPWVAEQTWRRRSEGIDTAEGLGAAMRAVVNEAGRDRQLALLRAHPDLAGRAARAGALTEASTNEQAGAGLDRCTDEEYDAFQTLNAAYTKRFGFPFIVAVAGLDRRQILARFRMRAGNGADEEFDTALDQVHRIAALRIAALFGRSSA